jgi:hypothetical protein
LKSMDEEGRWKKNKNSNGIWVENEYETGHSLWHNLFA